MLTAGRDVRQSARPRGDGGCAPASAGSECRSDTAPRDGIQRRRLREPDWLGGVFGGDEKGSDHHYGAYMANLCAEPRSIGVRASASVQGDRVQRFPRWR